MAWYDVPLMAINPMWGAQAIAGRETVAGSGIKDYASKAWQWGQQRPGAPSMGQNPYQSNWGNLIGQLEQQSRGEGPSLAGNAFREASDTAMKQQLAMSAGGSAGAARQAGLNMGQIGQGLAQGYSNARLQEQLAARQMLTGALSGAGQAWFQPNMANLQAQLQSPTNLQMITGLLQQGLTAGAMMTPSGQAARAGQAAGPQNWIGPPGGTGTQWGY